MYWFGGHSSSTSRTSSAKRRPAFKVRHGLNARQPISVFEEKMLAGMSRERNEVWVTAFCSESEVLRVTANVGSRYKSRATDDVSNWPNEARRGSATQIRQYHSHPPCFGRSQPSRTDLDSHRTLKRFVEQYDLGYGSYIAYPGLFGGMKVKRYGQLRTSQSVPLLLAVHTNPRRSQRHTGSSSQSGFLPVPLRLAIVEF